MKNKMKTLLLSMLLVMGVMAPSAFAAEGQQQNAIDEKLGVPIVVYGANLSEAEKATVKEALKVAEESEVQEITVSGEDLVKYIKDGNSSSRMYSSAKITRKNEGAGLVISIVTPENITEVSEEIYANAMLTAGIENAVVEVAAPKPVTGHSALVGIYKAYETTTGKKLDIERTDVANDELALATSIADKAGINDEKVAELLTEIKKQIAEQNPVSRDEVAKIVEDQLTNLQIELSDTDRQLLIDLMDKIRQLDIDFSKWSDQLSDISKTIEDKFGAILEDKGFWESVKTFFKDLMDTISTWLK